MNLPSLEKPKKISLADRLYRYLSRHQGEWINGGELEKLAITVGYKGSTAGRELRRLSELEMIKKEERGRIKSIWYCYE